MVLVKPPEGIEWDTRPDPPPSKAPLIFLLLLLALLGGGGYALYQAFWNRPVDRPSIEDRKREQFQIPRKTEVWDELRRPAPSPAPGAPEGPQPPEGKTPEEATKTPEAEAATEAP
ncbi:MAG: hypothetical protein M5U26_22015 [Planctomycetota bacterium]|nr:hypothetical protein [Planctomycetota bacterium]